MESRGVSKRLLSEIRMTALELQKLLTLPLADGSDSCDFDSFSDLNPFPTVKSATTIAPLMEEVESSDMEAYESAQRQAIDLWRVESLVQYSILQSMCNVAEAIACDAAEAALGCWKLVTALQKLLRLLSSGRLIRLCDGHDGVYRETVPHEQSNLADLLVVSENLTHPSKTPGRSRCSDLNRTDVFEIVEKICEQAEDERRTLETELRLARSELGRAQESHEVSRKTISHIKTQLESENKRYAYLEDSSSQIVSIVRDIATELDCPESGLSALQIAQSLKRQVKGLLTAFPWLRSWKKMEQPPGGSYGEVNPYQILRLKETELKEKVVTLEATTSFINDLGVELKGLKADRARLRGELESKNLLIQKLREEGTEKSLQIDRYRATFDALFEPNTAASFAKQVAEQYRRYESKSSIQSTLRSTSSLDTLPLDSGQTVPKFGERNVPPCSSCQRPRLDAEYRVTPPHSPRPLLPTKKSNYNKENVPDNMASKPLTSTQPNLEQVCINLGAKQPVRKPLDVSPMTTDSKRIRLAEKPLEAFTSMKYPHLSRRGQYGAESLSTSRPSPSCPLSSTEKHDPGCPTS